MNATETQFFFSQSSELQAAVRAGASDRASDALSELFALWLHSESYKIRNRCAGLLEEHGWGAEMDRACSR